MTRHERAQDQAREGAFHLARGDFQGSLPRFSEAIRKDPGLHVAYLGRGTAYVKLNRMDDARQDFLRAVELKPQDARSHHLLGLAYLHKGDQAAAREAFDRAITLKPGYGVATFSRGTVRCEMGDPDGGGKDMETAARIGEANLQNFSDRHNIWRTRFDKVMAERNGEREPDIAVKPDLTAWGDG